MIWGGTGSEFYLPIFTDFCSRFSKVETIKIEGQHSTMLNENSSRHMFDVIFGILQEKDR